MDTGNQFLGTERISKLMRRYAVPCIISLLVGALYNIVDQIFIANASYLGSYGNAANTVVFPLTVVALAVAVMVGDGCCAFVSMALGRNEMDKAKRSVGNAVVLTVASSLVLTALYLIFADGIIAMFGGTVNDGNLPLFPGILLLHHPGHPVLYVRPGHEPRHPCGRKPEVCHDLHPGGRGHQHYSGPHFHLYLRMGHDGRGCGNGYRPGGDGGSRCVVSAAHADHQARAPATMPCRGISADGC